MVLARVALITTIAKVVAEARPLWHLVVRALPVHFVGRFQQKYGKTPPTWFLQTVPVVLLRTIRPVTHGVNCRVTGGGVD